MKDRPDAVAPTWMIEAYDKNGDALIEDRQLPGLDIGMVRRLWELDRENPIAGMLPVGDRQSGAISRLIGRRLDVTMFDYFVSCVSDNGGVVLDQGHLFFTAPRTLRAFPDAIRVKPASDRKVRRRK